MVLRPRPARIKIQQFQKFRDVAFAEEHLQGAEKLSLSPSTELRARPELDEGTNGGWIEIIREFPFC